MKLTVDVLPRYEYAYRQPELVRPSLKYDNRATVVQSLAFWAEAQNRAEKLTAPEVELPSHPAELLAEGYAATFTA